MNFAEVVKDELFEITTTVPVDPKKKVEDPKGKKIKGKGRLFLMDIDDTLITADIKIWKVKEKVGDEYIELKPQKAYTPAQYADLGVTLEDKENDVYDYREFRDKAKTLKSIRNGKPIIPNLKQMDNYINNGWDIGILTARGLEPTISQAMQSWLMYRNSESKLKPIKGKLPRKRVFAINSRVKGKPKYEGGTDAAKKLGVIEKLAQTYKQINFIDDDLKNLYAVQDAKKKQQDSAKSREDTKKVPLANVHTIKAKEAIVKNSKDK